MKNNNFSDVVFNRRSIRVYDESIKIERQEMLEMINEAVKAPSSMNLQPWRFVVVDTPEGKEKLKPFIRFNTRQNDTSSAMLLIFGDMESVEYAEEIYNAAVDAGTMSQEMRDKQMEAIIPIYQNLTREKINDVVKIDSSLFAMQMMLVARHHGYDTNAIGGFIEDNLAETFGLDSTRYVPVLILSIGRAIDKGYESMRLDAERLTSFK